MEHNHADGNGQDIRCLSAVVPPPYSIDPMPSMPCIIAEFPFELYPYPEKISDIATSQGQ